MLIRRPSGYRKSSQAVVALVAIAAIALLAGCAPSIHSAQPPIHVHQNTPGATPTPTSTPTPTPTEPAIPPSLVNLTCAQVVSTPIVQTLMVRPGVAPETYLDAAYNEEPIFNIDKLALRQYGGLGCAWSLPTRDESVSLEILPNGAAPFAAASSALASKDDAVQHLVTSVPTWGDKSYTDCLGKHDPGQDCIFNILVGSYWIHIDESRQNGYKGAKFPEDPTQKAFLGAVVANVKALPASAAQWVAPAAASTIPTTCATDIPLATVKSAMALPSIAADPQTFIDVEPWDKAVFASTATQDCAWDGVASGAGAPTYVEVGVVPGSSWKWSLGTPPSHSAADHFATIAGIGDAAIGGCNTGIDQCAIYVEVASSWFMIDTGGPHANLARTETLAKAFVTSAS